MCQGHYGDTSFSWLLFVFALVPVVWQRLMETGVQLPMQPRMSLTLLPSSSTSQWLSLQGCMTMSICTYFLTETLVTSEQYFVLPKEMERAPNYPVSYYMCTAPCIYLRYGYNQRLPQRKIFLPLVWLSFLWFFLLFWALVGKLRICSHVTHWSIMHLFSLCITILLYISIYVIGIS